MCQNCDDSNHLPVIGTQTTDNQFHLPFFGADVGYQLPRPRIMARDNSPLVDATPAIKCACGCEVDSPDDTVVTESGETICTDCSVSCESCGKVFEQNDYGIKSAREDSYLRRSNTEMRCSECRETCADCDEEFCTLERTNCDDKKICERCSEHYSYCESCNSTIHDDNQRWDGVDEVSMCESCYDDLMRQRREDEEEEEEDSESREDDSVIHSYCYKPRPQFKTLPMGDSPLDFYGLEIEVESSAGDDHIAAIKSSGLDYNGLFYCKTDSSLDNGFEIVSHPASFAFWQAHDFKWASELRQLGYRSYDTTTCGMHIHVSRAALSDAALARLILFFKYNPEFIRYISRRKRYATAGDEILDPLNNYAKVDTSSTYNIIRKAKREAGDDETRYQAINVQNTKTIEFRIFRGTLDIGAIRRNIAIVKAMVEFASATSCTRLSLANFQSWLESSGKAKLGKMAVTLAIWARGYHKPETQAALSEIVSEVA